jgi:hypothetical protein
MFLSPTVTVNRIIDEEDVKILDALRAIRGTTGVGEALLRY